MSFLILGFITGLSLIFAIGAQNIFVIEQGLKKQYVFLVCLICSISDLILIFLGIFLFDYFKIYFTKNVELFFNILLSKRRNKNSLISLRKNNDSVAMQDFSNPYKEFSLPISFPNDDERTNRPLLFLPFILLSIRIAVLRKLI